MIDKIRAALAEYWGYRSFRPLQPEAMTSLAGGRDTLVVLPTGGGKSLCFQVPAVTLPGLAVVVCPLISLMKDQVDALTECGVAAARLDSSLTVSERDDVLCKIQNRELKLVYCAPERLVNDGFAEMLRSADVSFIAVDEAHCVSMWGHDFRPEYRQSGRLKQVFSGVPIGAYTATATDQVRQDIAEQLCLSNPEVLIGSFDRPNLIYKVQRLRDRVKQVCQVLDRHQGESGIIYCIRRKEVDQLSAVLAAKGHRVAAYHAGLPDEERKRSQDRFIGEEVDIIVATVAFGMGIDKSNVRYVVHTGMPKSLEHYQQESGRAGRDGLEAECCLFYGGADYHTWKRFAAELPEEARKVSIDKLNQMFGFCTGGTCRHQEILAYFGQSLDKEDCGACDVCLGQLECVENGHEITQKIVSCVLRLGQQYGAGYTAQVLVGSRDKRILESRHDLLSTYGLLDDFEKRHVHDWIEQLVGQGYLAKTGEFNVLCVTHKGASALKGLEQPRLLQVLKKAVKQSRVVQDSWEGVDRQLFETLRKLRSSLAAKKRVPAYVVFGDAALRDMARRRPSGTDRFLEVKGVGQKKCQQYGKVMLETIHSYCAEQGVGMDVDLETSGPTYNHARP
ncbi:MAG: DNA helicase RecQ [Planctomycetes bacterium]|nr:DNA helicase RecQ [Planctomycetota bacterium]